MDDLALFDETHGRKLQWFGGLLVVLSLCSLSGFFIDLMQALALRSPIPHGSDWMSVLAGMSIALLIPIGGACAGIPDRRQGWLSKQSKVTGLLVFLGCSIALARYAKALDHLQTQQLEATESARSARLQAATADAQSPEAQARAEIMKAKAKLLTSSADALEKGARRLTPKVREHAVAMAKLATTNLQVEARPPPPPQATEDFSVPTVSTVTVMQAVVGPALTEFLLAELIAFVAAIWGAAAFAPACC